MVLEKKIKEVKKKEESVLKFLMKDFYELEAILSLIKEAEKEKRILMILKLITMLHHHLGH